MMRKKSAKKTTVSFCVCALLAVFLLPFSAHAAVNRPASIEASGEGAIFDVKATADGTLRVGTKAGRVGDRWRVTIAKANSSGAVSAVGTGSSTTFSGYASLAVAANVRYVVLVTWDRPLPGTFPARATVRFTGGMDSTNPPVVQLNGGALTGIVPRPIRWSEPPTSCPGDGATIGCESMVACEFNPGGDTDTFRIAVPANSDLSINLAGPYASRWKIFDPEGGAVNVNGCAGLCEVALTTAGTYTIQTYNTLNSAGAYQLSILGVSTPFRCGPRLISGGSPVTEEFDPNGDTDSFQLNNVLAGETYSISVTGPFGTRWKIFDPTGNAVNVNGCPGLCEVNLPQPGGYTVVVYNTLQDVGQYTLSVQKVGG